MSVIPLKVGSILREEEKVIDARSTVTLIESGDKRIIVDTGFLGEEGILTDALAARGLSPMEIDVVVNTHLHLDHCGCNILFKKAVFYADRKENPPVHFRPTIHDFKLAPGVRFMSTPGHTAGSISIVAEDSGNTFVIAGDAIPTRENFETMVPPAININERLALKSMKMIIERADFIIPGHGAMFRVER